MSLTERDIVMAAVKQQMQKTVTEMQRELDAQLYYCDPSSFPRPELSNSERRKLKLRAWKNNIKLYFSNLWKALKNDLDELDEPDDYY